MRVYFICFALFSFLSCNSNEEEFIFEPSIEENLYFPPINSDTWETISTSEIGWNITETQPLLDFLEATDTEAFIILYNGKIALESYFNGANSATNNPWFSAGKTLVAATMGIAEDDGFLDINETSSNYLGIGWSDLTPEQESIISIKNHLTMTTGLDYNVDFTCTNPECLTFLNNPDDFWYYHNAPYSLTRDIIAGATNMNFENYFNNKLKNQIGMQGSWISIGFNSFYVSNARSMARFGLLNLNKGKWEDTQILNSDYFEAMTNTSQNLNPSYGYLWWLNGKSSHRLPSSTESFEGKLIQNAPDDLIGGLGANDQKLYIIPSKKLVIIRMGNSGDNGQLGPSSYDNALWEKINALID